MKRSKRIAVTAVGLALIILFGLMPISFGSATIALTLLPVLVLALTQDFKTAAAGGLFMGLVSLIGAFTTGAGNPTAPLFRNPLVSILPRILAPVAARAVQRLCLAIAGAKGRPDKNRPGKAAKLAIDAFAAAVGVVTNTATVLGMIWLLYGGKTVGDSAITPEFMMGMISINFVIEIIVFTLLTPPVVYAVTAREGRSDASGD